MQPPEHLISYPGEPFQREFTPEEGELSLTEMVDETMDWFQQEEPVRRRPPRQLRSRTIGQVIWDSEFGYRVYDAEEGTLQEEIRELLPILETSLPTQRVSVVDPESASDPKE